MTGSSPQRPAVSVGAVFRPQIAPERLGAAAAAADAAGLDELWLWEDCFLTGGISTAAIALANSQRLKAAIGVLPVPMRSLLGVGVGSLWAPVFVGCPSSIPVE